MIKQYSTITCTASSWFVVQYHQVYCFIIIRCTVPSHVLPYHDSLYSNITCAALSWVVVQYHQVYCFIMTRCTVPSHVLLYHDSFTAPSVVLLYNKKLDKQLFCETPNYVSSTGLWILEAQLFIVILIWKKPFSFHGLNKITSTL